MHQVIAGIGKINQSMWAGMVVIKSGWLDVCVVHVETEIHEVDIALA